MTETTAESCMICGALYDRPTTGTAKVRLTCSPKCRDKLYHQGKGARRRAAEMTGDGTRNRNKSK
jgi:hypothetical protein